MANPSAVSRALLRQLAPQRQYSKAESRDAAFGFIQRFSKFAEKTCGCTAISHRVHVRRAVFHAAKDVDLAPFVTHTLGGNALPLESIAKMPCPVQARDKTMVRVRVPESSAKRIIFAAKALRRHFSLSETQTCRGCEKRSRCKFFKTPHEEGIHADVGHVCRVLFGMAQYARAHLQRPDVFPMYFSAENIGSAGQLMDAIGDHLRNARGHPLYSDLGVADDATAREVLLRQAQKQMEKKQQVAEERLLSLPQWMRDTLQPLPGRGMLRKQRALLQQLGEGASEVNDGDGIRPSQRRRFEDDNKGEWAEEGAMPGEPLVALAADPVPLVAPPLKPGEGEGPVNVLNERVKDLPIPRRFRHVSPEVSRGAGPEFSSTLGGRVCGIYKIDGGGMGHRIDLDAVADGATARDDVVGSKEERFVEMQGGYSIVDFLKADSFGNVPKEALQYVSLSPRALEGVQRYDGGDSAIQINPELLEKLWNRNPAGKDELPFLSRIPFDSGVGRSGGSAPISSLPRHLLVSELEPIVPPPSRECSSSSSSSTPVVESDMHQHRLIELDSPEASTSPEMFTADEELAASAFAAGDNLGFEHQASERPRSIHAPGAAAAAAADAEDDEDFRFKLWSSKAQQRPVGVFQPAVDMGSLSDPRRLERVGQMNTESEADVNFFDPEPLPHDEDFISAFRQPLQLPEDQDMAADPLATASPGVDVRKVIEGRNAALQARQEGQQRLPAAGPELEQDDSFVMGGEVMFPKIPGVAPLSSHASAVQRASERQHPAVMAQHPAPAAASPSAPTSPLRAAEPLAAKAIQQLPPRLGKLRQARIEDLRDLVKPGSKGASPPGSRLRGGMLASLGEVACPGGAEDDSLSSLQQPARTAAELRDQRNVAEAMQRTLHKQLKETTRREFPGRPLAAPRRAGHAKGGRQDASPGRRATLLDVVSPEPWRK